MFFFDVFRRRFAIDFPPDFSSVFEYFLRKSRKVRKWLSTVNLQYIVRVGLFEIGIENDGKKIRKLDGKKQENRSKNGVKNRCAKSHEKRGLQVPNLVPKMVPGTSPEGARRVPEASRGRPDHFQKKRLFLVVFWDPKKPEKHGKPLRPKLTLFRLRRK